MMVMDQAKKSGPAHQQKHSSASDMLDTRRSEWSCNVNHELNSRLAGCCCRMRESEVLFSVQSQSGVRQQSSRVQGVDVGQPECRRLKGADCISRALPNLSLDFVAQLERRLRYSRNCATTGCLKNLQLPAFFRKC